MSGCCYFQRSVFHHVIICYNHFESHLVVLMLDKQMIAGSICADFLVGSVQSSIIA